MFKKSGRQWAKGRVYKVGETGSRSPSRSISTVFVVRCREEELTIFC